MRLTASDELVLSERSERSSFSSSTAKDGIEEKRKEVDGHTGSTVVSTAHAATAGKSAGAEGTHGRITSTGGQLLGMRFDAFTR